ncbi:biosynthetic-type acetolactate synthase large subunit [Blautia pseudococcoides]|uniref:biosynthetic-type acetolactate synthase large subunit n=1 Tax=Blautia pseudococcoides TaxID=1796616 RepID=UPI00148AE38D|nr:biosynthetic-type acetolactate synthase large subunit [Blautia pseudococcoides]QJU14868.1 biosynthetic-type acetolactate synthase large subunit [Blautia pseudococcoides]
MQLTGAEIVIECLKEQGVDTVFGYPGGTILNIYDELYKHSHEIHHVLTSHEQGAAHAADGFARSTGKVGVCFATSGPGATNLVTGIATAHMDSVPVVAITCNVGVPLLGKDSFQEVDIAGVVMPITKHSFIVKDVKKLAKTIRRAFVIAKSGRPGPVLVDITKDVTAAKTDFENIVPKPVKPSVAEIEEADLAKVADMIQEAKRPFIFVGGGAIAANAWEELRIFAHKIQAPVTDSLMGKGAFSGEDELYTGMLGMHGTKASNLGVTKCDLLITVGARFSDRVTGNTRNFARNAKVIQIDVDAAEINKNVLVDCSVVGDAREVLKRLNDMLEQKEHKEWLEYVEELKEKYPLRYNEEGLSGPAIIEEIYHQTKGDAIIVTEVGQHQMWAAQYYKYKTPRTFLSSGGLGTMGYGLGAAIGAKMGNPDKVVINVAGDGCFRMNMNEIATATRNDVPLIQVVINNQVLGMVRQWQTLFYEGRYSNTVLKDKVDFVKLAEAMGAVGIRVTTKEELREALAKAIELNTTVVLDCMIDSDDKVFPMVPAGANIEDAFDEEDLKAKQK